MTPNTGTPFAKVEVSLEAVPNMERYSHSPFPFPHKNSQMPYSSALIKASCQASLSSICWWHAERCWHLTQPQSNRAKTLFFKKKFKKKCSFYYSQGPRETHPVEVQQHLSRKPLPEKQWDLDGIAQTSKETQQQLSWSLRDSFGIQEEKQEFSWCSSSAVF